MKFVIVLVAVVAVCAAAPAPAPGDEVSATSLRDIRQNNGVDAYQFDFETSNGIKRQESGQLKQIDENSAIVVTGSVKWTAPNGEEQVLNFTADENGYHPVIA